MLGAQIKRFINLIDEDFIKPKKEEFYDIQKSFKKCREVIQTFIHRKKLKKEKFYQMAFNLVFFIFKKS